MISRILWMLLLVIASANSFGQQAQEQFGKNRIQYKNFKWKYFSSFNFEIYYYQGGEELAQNAANYAETDFQRISDLIGFSPYSKIKLIVYNSGADMLQSNIGIEDNSILIGGQTHFVKSKIEVAFNGSHEQFKKDISFGISQMMINLMLYGGSLKDIVQSSYLLSLPDWYVDGAAAYVAYGWSIEMDNRVRDIIMEKDLKKPSMLIAEDATFAGQSIWNFIVEEHGKSHIANILNLTRILRNEESSIESTLGTPYSVFMKEWISYYTGMSEKLKDQYQKPAKESKIVKRKRKGYHYSNTFLNQDGSKLAYVKSFKGKYYVVVYDVSNKKDKIVYRGGNKLLNQQEDENVIQLAWQSARMLTFIEKKRDKLWLTYYDLKKGRQAKKNLDFNQGLSYSFNEDGTQIILSADNGGQSDIYLYDVSGNSTKQITNDLYDDLCPAFISGNSMIAFSSNRLRDSLKTKGTFKSIVSDYNIFIYDARSRSNALKRITSSGRNFMPQALDKENILYLSDEKGIFNLYKYNLKSQAASQLSSYFNNIDHYDIDLSTKSLVFTSLDKGKEFVYLVNGFDFNTVVNPSFTERQRLLDLLRAKNKPVVILDTVSLKDTLPDEEINISDLTFETDVKRKKEKELKEKENFFFSDKQKTDANGISIKGPYDYKHDFSVEKVNSTVMIDPLRGFGILMEAQMSDMMGNHRMNAGLFGLTDLKSSNVFGEYAYLKHRVDFKARYDRKTYYAFNETVTHRYTLNKAALTMCYPLSVSERISVSPFVVHTRFTDLNFLAQQDVTKLYGGLRGEYVFDNTMITGMNMIEGTRCKVMVEQYANSESSAFNFGKFMIDIRNYRALHKDLVLATRLSYGQFFGNAKKNFLLGGMDNWLFNKTENHGPGDPLNLELLTDNSDVLFAEYVTNLRGFNYNAQFGPKYALFNAELRLPIVKYLYNGVINSNFLNNLQLITFTDIGASWEGKSPFSRDNSTNTVFVGGGSSPFSATVVNYKNPFLTGYGAGIRTLFLGYYVKFDVAWAMVDYKVTGKKFYLTFGYDF
ncbi:MAG: hypothetical protein K2X86_08480 [Cytophagaceae bacterium]|nr:hypothetical protein [Cytophagaceae bacterium]